jgi:hypothetical protein
MRLRDKVAALFDDSGSSSSEDSINVTEVSQTRVAQHQRDQVHVVEASGRDYETHVSVPLSESPASKALDTPAPQKHPCPTIQSHSHLSIGHTSVTPSHLHFRHENRQRGPHVALLAMRKGTLDCLVKAHANVPSNVVSLLIAASSLGLPPSKSNWEHIQMLLKQRRYIPILSRVVLDIDTRSPQLLLPREYVSNNTAPPTFHASSEASQGLIIIHNWLVRSSPPPSPQCACAGSFD